METLPCPGHSLITSDKNWVGIGVGTLEGIIEHESRGTVGPPLCLPPLQMSWAKSVRGVTEGAWEGRVDRRCLSQTMGA